MENHYFKSTFNPFPHSKCVTSLSLLHDPLTIWLQKLHAAVGTPTHFYTLKAMNLINIHEGKVPRKKPRYFSLDAAVCCDNMFMEEV